MREGEGRRGGLGPLVFVALLGLAGTGLRAQERPEAHEDAHTHESTQDKAHDAHEQAGEHGEPGGEFAGHHVHADHRNGLSLYLGGTRETAEDETFFTIGIEYERLLADRWALQLVVEHVNDFDAWVVAAPVGFRVAGTLWAMAGPGLETEPRRPPLVEVESEGHSTEPSEDGGPFFLWRFGLMYGIHLGQSGRFGLFPSFSLDLVREHGEWVEAWVFGVGLSYHF
jgi:hypothetical protein